MSEILKPCPFCGGKSKIIQTTESYPNYVVQCSFCGISTISCPNSKGLVEFWNTRANEKEQKVTNYEKIKNMTVEKMVEFICCEGTCNYCIYADDNCKRT